MFPFEKLAVWKKAIQFNDKERVGVKPKQYTLQ